jgi:hypothetical protein
LNQPRRLAALRLRDAFFFVVFLAVRLAPARFFVAVFLALRFFAPAL